MIKGQKRLVHGKQRTKNRLTLPVVVAVAQQRSAKALSARVYKIDAGSGNSITSDYMHCRLVLKVAEGAQESQEPLVTSRCAERRTCQKGG